MFLYDITKEKIDIVKTITPVKVFFKIFEIPLKSIVPLIDFIIEKHKQILTIGKSPISKKFSISEINKSTDVAETDADVIFPLNIYIIAIIGAKAVIKLQHNCIYAVACFARVLHTLKTVIATQIVEQIEKAFFNASDLKEFSSICKIDEIIIIQSREKKVLITLPIFDVI